MSTTPLRGRGASSNPPNRFERIEFTRDPDAPDDPAPRTEFLRDVSRSVISTNDSPDLPFEASLNPYRGCEHGCTYCYARPTHEFLGFSAGLDFETRILVKEDAPELLRRELASPRWTPKLIALSGVTDPYQPVERRLGLTRRCIEVLAEFRNPVGVVTKNRLVTRDLDLLGVLAADRAAMAFLSVTTLDAELAGDLEPRTARPRLRLEAIRELSSAGIPTGVLVAPVIPGLTDHEIPSILEACREAGASFAGWQMLRLPHANTDLFERWLEERRPTLAGKVLHRIRDVRQGRMNDPSFGSRMTGSGVFADQIRQFFEVTRRRLGYGHAPEVSTSAFRRPPGPQLELF